MGFYSYFVTTIALSSIWCCIDMSCEQDKISKELTRYKTSLQNISATKCEVHGADYLSVRFDEKEIKLFQYEGKYQTKGNISEQEMQKAERQAESNLVEIIGGEIK
jgi:inhibitor of KinA sporulation pathway (predicted exonuclease)